MKRPRTAALVLATALATAPAGAAEYRPARGLALSLDVSRSVTDLRYENGRRVESRYTRVGVDLRTRELGWIELGLTGGLGWLSLDDDPATAGRTLDGESLGLIAAVDRPLNDALALTAQARWTYHDLSDDGDGSEARIDLTWYETRARAGLSLNLDGVRLGAGGTYTHIDGERRRPGSTLDVEAEDAAGAYATLGIPAGPGGEVTLRLETGARDAFTVAASRRF